ncbi:hypothetical protein UPYG_G00029140 [Umbra pygmaea]|uniref:Retrotransposon gag domain-containing protein n=1 Tax=Umbra pygmaea TaxID=75934 RepID=A0ABD0XMD4_UMBPY
MSDELRTGQIMTKLSNNESDQEVLARLKACLITLRGPTSSAWDKILCIKQGKEPFETFAESAWQLFQEFSGLEHPTRDNNILLELLKTNAGSHVQQAFNHGASSPHNTFDSLVDWVTRMENRLKITKPECERGTAVPAQGFAKGGEIKLASSGPKQQSLYCAFCHKLGHSIEVCRQRQRQITPKNSLSQTALKQPNVKHGPQVFKHETVPPVDTVTLSVERVKEIGQSPVSTKSEIEHAKLQPTKQKKPRCSFCHRTGHTKAQC